MRGGRVLRLRGGSNLRCRSASRVTTNLFVAAAAVPAMVWATSCEQPASAPLPPGRPVIDLIMRDYAFDYATPVPSGQVLFRVLNAGRVNHRLILVPIPDEFPTLDELLESTEGRIVTPLVGIPDRPPGGEDSFAVFLPPGRYGIICFTRTEDGQPHSKKGMFSEFRVSPS